MRWAATPTPSTTPGDSDREGPPRSRAQKMADCLMDLVLRPGEIDLPVVQAQVTLVAPVATMLGGDQPAEVAGTPVPAELARALAQGLGLLPAPAVDHDDAQPPVVVDDSTDSALAAADEAWWAEVEARALRGEWGGDEDPPPEELERWWADTEKWCTARLAHDDVSDEPIPLPLSAPLPLPPCLGRTPTRTRSRRGGPRRMRPSRRPARRTWRCTVPWPGRSAQCSPPSWPTGRIRTPRSSPRPPGCRRRGTR